MNLTINAYAKINLTLDVLAKRPDGFHEVEMVMQSIALADTLSFQPANNLELICNDSRLPTNEQNLIMQAALSLKERYNVSKGVKIYLQKNIPIAAGLAGGSSNAAATLQALNLLWDLRLSIAELIYLGQSLGSDIPFCLIGGTALAKGRGEQLTLLPRLPKLWLVLVKPDLEVSTKEIYRHWEKFGQNQTKRSPQMIQAIKENNVENIIINLNNHLECVTSRLYPEIRDIKHRLREQGTLNAVMSGSGPTFYGITKDETDAYKLKQYLSRYYQHVFVTHTL